MKPIVRYVIDDVDLRNGHDGLDLILKKEKKGNDLMTKTLRDKGGLVLFLNTKRTKAKLYSEGGHVLGYFSTRSGRKLTPSCLDEIPATFGGSVEYAAAVKTALKQLFRMEEKVRQEMRAG